MDSNKVIIMEVKDDYAIVMTSDFEFIKIKKKKSMTEGQKIYIVDEDIYIELKEPLMLAEDFSFYQKAIPGIFFFLGTKCQETSLSNKNKLLKILGLVAILLGIILLAFLFNPFKKDTYATASFDGDASIEFSLDENKKITKAISRDDSIPSVELENLKGKSFEYGLDEIDDYLENDNYILASCYVPNGENDNYIDDIRSTIDKELSEVIFINASKNDVKQAQKENKTLGQYKLQSVASLSELEKYINTVNYNKLDKFVLTNNSTHMRQQIKNKRLNDKDDEDDDDDQEDEKDDD